MQIRNYEKFFSEKGYIVHRNDSILWFVFDPDLHITVCQHTLHDILNMSRPDLVSIIFLYDMVKTFGGRVTMTDS